MNKRGWKFYRSPNPNPRGYESAIAPINLTLQCSSQLRPEIIHKSYVPALWYDVNSIPTWKLS